MITLHQPNYPPNILGDNIDSAYPDFEYDLQECLERSGQIEKFRGRLNQRLRWLNEHGTNCVMKRDWFERLKHDKKNMLYSLKIKDDKNIRIIFVFHKHKPLFLSAFQEKDNKKGKSYSDGMSIAHERLKLLSDAGLINEEDILCHTN